MLAAAGGATAGGDRPSLTLRRPAGPAFTGPEARSPSVTAGRPGGTRRSGLPLAVLVAAALCAGVWWYVRDRPGPASGPTGPATSATATASDAATSGGAASPGEEKAAPAPRSEAPEASATGAGTVVRQGARRPRPAAAARAGPAPRRSGIAAEAREDGPAGGHAEPPAVTPGSAGSAARPGGGGAPAGPAAPGMRGDRGSGAPAASAGGQPPRRHPTVPPLEPGVEAPEPADVPDAVYPEAARGSGLAPTVRLAVLVDEKGNVAEVRVLEGDTSHLGFNEAAVAAVRRAHFVAATRDGTPVRAWSELAVDFVSPARP